MTKNAFEYPIAKPGEDGIGHDARCRFFPDDHVPGETRRVYEQTETVGQLQHTRRLVIESYDNEPLHQQVFRLASFIMANFDGEPSEEGGAVDTAIRLLDDYAASLRARKSAEEGHSIRSVLHIAEGLRAGQAKQIYGETQDVTTSPAFVNIGTHARPMTEEEIEADFLARQAQKPPLGPVPPAIAAELAARADGSNVPAVESAPLARSLAQHPEQERRYYPDERAYDVVSPQPSDDEIPF